MQQAKVWGIKWVMDKYGKTCGFKAPQNDIAKAITKVGGGHPTQSVISKLARRVARCGASAFKHSCLKNCCKSLGLARRGTESTSRSEAITLRAHRINFQVRGYYIEGPEDSITQSPFLGLVHVGLSPNELLGNRPINYAVSATIKWPHEMSLDFKTGLHGIITCNRNMTGQAFSLESNNFQ